jgi:hypothetical protein
MAGASLQMARFVKLNANVNMLSSRTNALVAFSPTTQRRTIRTSTLCQMSTAGNYGIQNFLLQNIIGQRQFFCQPTAQL